MKKYSEIIGWIGTALILSAYFALTYQYLTPKDEIYHIINIIASSLLVYSVYQKKAWAFLVFQSIWGAIALFNLVRIIL